MRLTVELVPSSCFYKNVRQILTKTRWSVISKRVRSQAYDTCEICHSSPKQYLDCHEVWLYDDKNLIQKLIKMIALCKDCHSVKHIGLAQLQGKGELALKHLMKVNGLDRKRAEKYIADVFMVWAERSGKSWKLDISSLAEYGIDTNNINKGH